MPSCVVTFCKNHSGLMKKHQGITFHRFPKTNEVWRKTLINIIRESRHENNWLPSKSSVICSEHFDTEDLYTTKEGRIRVATYAVPKKLLSNLPDIQKQKTSSSPTILQESSNVEVAKDPPGSTSLSTTSTLLTTQVPVLVKEELIEYCRLCAASDCVGELLNLQSDDNLRKLVVKMTKRLNTNIDFSQEHLPTSICSACVKALYTAYDFVVGIDQAQITLNNKLIQKGVHQMPGNRNLDNNLDLPSMSLQQISTNKRTTADEFEFEQKPLHVPSTDFLLPQVSSNNEIAASDFKQPLLPMSNTTVPLIRVSTNIGPAVSKIEQPPPIDSSSNSPTWLDAAAKRMKCSSYDLSKQVQRIDGQRKNIKILNQKIRRLQKRNESLKNLIITLKKKNTDTNPLKKFKQ